MTSGYKRFTMKIRQRGNRVEICQYLVPAAQPPRAFCLDLVDDGVVRNYKVLGKPARASLERRPGSLRMWIRRELPVRRYSRIAEGFFL